MLLSIGYSACHWCHVMERESFENEDIAALMNERFVNIKVDREERPELDAIYMNYVQMTTGSGGWPLTVFLTPGGVPFFGGTYFPPADHYGRPGFPKVLKSAAAAFRDRREDLEKMAPEIVSRLRRASELETSRGDLSPALLEQAASQIGRSFRSPSRRVWWCSQVSPVHGTRFPDPPPYADRFAAIPGDGGVDADENGPRGTLRSAGGRISSPIRSTISGSFPTSRRCSTTTPSWPRFTWRLFR